jgi:NAD(P)-dependent dehydrogenase (short-subunit alcohol dehydrogenase family)
VANQTLYNTMKAAVAELTRSLAADLMADGIRVNAVLPGAISHTYEHGRDYRGLRRLGGLVGTPEDAAHAALFLASPEASWITGACLVVDGGFHVNRRHGPD